MSKKATPAVIGGFVLLALLIAVAAIIGLGSGQFFKESTEYILQFESDLSGLDTGAPVTYKGVAVGQVKEISLIYDHATDQLCTPVIIEIMRESFVEKNADQADKKHHLIQLQIERGMRARLASQSLVTGKLKVDLDIFPDTEIVYRAGDHPLDEIPTIPMALESLAKRISKLPLEEIVVDLRDSIKGIAKVIDSGEIETTLNELHDAIQKISELIGSEEVASATLALEESLQETRELIYDFRVGSKPIRREIAVAIEEFSKAARTANSFMDYIDRHPEALLRGKESD